MTHSSTVMLNEVAFRKDVLKMFSPVFRQLLDDDPSCKSIPCSDASKETLEHAVLLLDLMVFPDVVAVADSTQQYITPQVFLQRKTVMQLMNLVAFSFRYNMFAIVANCDVQLEILEKTGMTYQRYRGAPPITALQKRVKMEEYIQFACKYKLNSFLAGILEHAHQPDRQDVLKKMDKQGDLDVMVMMAYMRLHGF